MFHLDGFIVPDAVESFVDLYVFVILSLTELEGVTAPFGYHVRALRGGEDSAAYTGDVLGTSGRPNKY